MISSDLGKFGYYIVPQLINNGVIITLKQEILKLANQQSPYGIRNLNSQILEINNLANSELILNTLRQYTNYSRFRLIKAIFFNKNQHYNWIVGWHQDKTIAVKEKILLPNFQNWTVKQEIPHVQPPRDILEKITTIRIALDDTDEKNGALKIILQSHHLGILNQEQINQIISNKKPLLCSLKAGDALIMHPLLLHSSRKSNSQGDRDTIHLEYSSCDLPKGLAWN